MDDLRGKCLDERGYFTFFRCNYEQVLCLNSEQQTEFLLAFLKYNFTDISFDDIEIKDEGLKLFWLGIKPSITNSRNKFVKNNEKDEAKAAKKDKKPKNTKKDTNPKVNSKSAVKSSPVDSNNKDLTKSEVISHIHLNLDIDSGLALEIYKYRVLKKVSNTEEALDRFCEQIKNGVKESEVPIIKVVNHYCEGKWKEFKDSWTKELVDTQSNVEVATPVVEVADKIISLLTETLDISKDYAENIIQFRKTHNQPNNEMALLNWCSEISKASHLAERSVNDVLDFIFLKNYKSFNASWFVDYVSAETEALKKKEASDKVDPLTAKGLSYLSQGEKEKLIREKRANNIRMGIPNRDDEDSSHVFREKGSNNLITMEQNNE